MKAPKGAANLAIRVLCVLGLCYLLVWRLFGSPLSLISGNGGQPTKSALSVRSPWLGGGGGGGIVRLRGRSEFHEWQGARSEYLKKSRLGRYVFVFHEEKSGTGVVAPTLMQLSHLTFPESFSFISVGKLEYLDAFQSVIDEDFGSTMFPAAVLFTVVPDVRRYVLPIKDIIEDDEVSVREKRDELRSSLVRQLINPYFEGNLTQYLRNQSVDQLYGGSALIPINSARFQSMVKKETGVKKGLPGATPDEFFVLFYAPWCGHCRRVQNELTFMAEQTAHPDKLAYYIMDSTRNDIDWPPLTISRVPQIHFFTPKLGYDNPISLPIDPENLTPLALKQLILKNSINASYWRRKWADSAADEL